MYCIMFSKSRAKNFGEHAMQFITVKSQAVDCLG